MKEFDLYEIVVSAELDCVRGIIRKYRVKRTEHYFIQMPVTDDLEAAGYIYIRIESAGRLKTEELNKIRRIGFSDSVDHVYRCCYTTHAQIAITVERLKKEIATVVINNAERARMLAETWTAQSEEMKLKSKPGFSAKGESLHCEE